MTLALRASEIEGDRNVGREREREREKERVVFSAWLTVELWLWAEGESYQRHNRSTQPPPIYCIYCIYIKD